MPIISKECHFGYDDLFEAMRPYAFVQTMEVGGCRHERGYLRVDMIAVPPGGFWADTQFANPDNPTRQEFATKRRMLHEQAEHAIMILEAAGFDHLREPDIHITADSGRRLECHVICEGAMSQ